jgi:hypothetical protein
MGISHPKRTIHPLCNDGAADADEPGVNRLDALFLLKKIAIVITSIKLLFYFQQKL